MNSPRKIRIPDGQGGWKFVETTEEPKKVDISEERIQDRLQKAQEDDFFGNVGGCTDALSKFVEIYARDHNLTPEEAIAAVYLENLNNREYYTGGAEQFDKICKDVWEWFEKHKE